ncbi:MAG: putative LPS assembly protein LptD [Candidatus Aerophobetes bacterium]|nr:putative LPS assembly protein LptD [Candidatus Aerophobetes bacterium]
MKIWKVGIGAVIFFIITSSSSSSAFQIEFQANHLYWIENPPLLEMLGEAKLIYENTEIKADNIKLDLENFDLVAEGKVNLQIGKDEVRGEKLEYNLKKRKGIIFYPKGREELVFYKAKKAYISPELIELLDASLTTCNLSPPHYQIKADKIKLYIGEEIIAEKVTFYAGEIPLFWLPIFVRNFKKENKLIFPSIGYSDFAGWYIRSGYYFYASPQLRGTFHLNYREKKGWAEGLDISYRLRGGAGEIRTYFTKEKDSREKRWRLKLRHKHSFSRSTSLKISLDRVSDRYFLKDYFPEEEKNDEIPSSFISLNYEKSDYNVNLLFEPEVNPFIEGTIERLPQIKLSFPSQKIKGPELTLKKGAETINFRKGKDNIIRTESFLELSRSFTIFKRLKMGTQAGYHLFWYNSEQEKDGYRRIPYQKLSLSFQTHGGRKENYTYLLEPYTSYYHSTEDKNDFSLPFSLGDYEKKTKDIHPPNLIKLGARTHLYYKGRSFSSGNLSMGYNLTKEERRLSSLEGNFRFTPPVPLLNYINFYFLYDYYDKEYKKIISSLDLKGKNWHINAGVNKDVDEGENDFILQEGISLGKKWRISGYDRYDLETGKISEEKYSIWRDLHCWAAQLSIKVKPEREYWAMFYIKAFPQIRVEFYPEAPPYVYPHIME